MRKIVYIVCIVVASLFQACNEEPVGQTPTNNVMPPSVAEPKVENTAGGAIISYTLPKGETDISYVRAEYMYKGNLKSNKSSIYKNFVKIEGFASIDPVEVKLYTVNHSEVSSDPLLVTINPLTPPVFNITSSFTYKSDFGGLRVNWENVTGEEMVVTLMAFDDELKRYTDKDAIYSSAQNGQYSFRGFESEPTRFGLYVRDKYFNISDTVTFELTPMYETMIKTDNFARVMDIPLDDLTALSGWGFEKMWDGVTAGDAVGWHSSGTSDEKIHYWTWDLGSSVRLSRFTIWHRSNTPYGNANPKKFQIWGATDYNRVNKDENYWKQGGAWETDGNWVYLGAFEIKKPSGDGAEVTEEDKQAIVDGFEFMIPLDVKPVRYLRFGDTENFSGGLGVHISEIRYWGDDSVQK